MGETRAVLKLLSVLSANVQCHRAKFINLEDNMACAGALAKGRSSSAPLNFLLRRRCAFCVGAELVLLAPWVESCKQPADEASRYVDGAAPR